MLVPTAEGVLNQASQCLQLGSYRNQLMHFVVREAILASVLLSSANAGRTTCRIGEAAFSIAAVNNDEIISLLSAKK